MGYSSLFHSNRHTREARLVFDMSSLEKGERKSKKHGRSAAAVAASEEYQIYYGITGCAWVMFVLLFFALFVVLFAPWNWWGSPPPSTVPVMGFTKQTLAFRDFSTLDCTSIFSSPSCEEGGDIQWWSGGVLKAQSSDTVIGVTHGHCVTVEQLPATHEFLQQCYQTYEFSNGIIEATGLFLETDSPAPYVYRTEHWTVTGGTGLYKDTISGWFDITTTADSYHGNGEIVLIQFA